MAGEQQAAETIAAFRRTYAVSNLGLLAVQHPRREEIITDILGFDRGSTLRLGMRDDPAKPGQPVYYEGLDVWESIDSVVASADFNLYFLSVWFMVVLSAVGQIASDNGYWDCTPELELLRHLRNGVSHGNRFNLHQGQPSRPAHFGSHQLTQQNNGDTVLFEFMSPGDLFSFLDHIEAHLRSRV
jgi:hypothetical protein